MVTGFMPILTGRIANLAGFRVRNGNSGVNTPDSPASAERWLSGCPSYRRSVSRPVRRVDRVQPHRLVGLAAPMPDKLAIRIVLLRLFFEVESPQATGIDAHTCQALPVAEVTDNVKVDQLFLKPQNRLML